MERKRLVRIRGGFSDRNNINSISKAIQENEFTDDTRIVLYNFINTLINLRASNEGPSWSFEPHFAREMAMNVFCIDVDSEEAYYDNIELRIKELFFEGYYDDILTFLEYIANHWKVMLPNQYGCYVNLFKEFNDLFISECIGYRFANKKILKTSSKEEIESINQACTTKYDKVNVHMANAVDALSSKTNRDYKNCIVECSHALEVLLNILLNTNGLVLSNALQQYFDKNKKFHESFKDAIKGFYKYSSDGAGIRHDSNTKDYKEGYDEAKLFLVNTSGFINYLLSISK